MNQEPCMRHTAHTTATNNVAHIFVMVDSNLMTMILKEKGHKFSHVFQTDVRVSAGTASFPL
jgi:hypothetical protein